MTTDPFGELSDTPPPAPPTPTPAPPPTPADTQLARLHSHEIAIQRVEALATLTIEADGEKTVDAARKAAKAVRCEIETCRKALNSDALDWQRRVNDLAKRLTARVQPVELAMESQLDRVKAEKAAAIRRQQTELNDARLQQLRALHGEWGVAEMRAIAPLALVGHTPESWSHILDTVLPQRKREQEIQARQRAAAEAERDRLRQEALECERVQQAARDREIAERAAERQRIAEQAMEDRRRKEQEWEALETARLESPTCQNQMLWLSQLDAMILQHRFSGPPIGTDDQLGQIQDLTMRYLQTIRSVLHLYRRPFPG